MLFCEEGRSFDSGGGAEKDAIGSGNHLLVIMSTPANLCLSGCPYFILNFIFLIQIATESSHFFLPPFLPLSSFFTENTSSAPTFWSSYTVLSGNPS